MPCAVKIKKNLEEQVDKMSAKAEGKSIEYANNIAKWINGIFKIKVIEFVKNGDFTDKIINIPQSLVKTYYNNELKIEQEEQAKKELEQIGKPKELTDEEFSEEIRKEQEERELSIFDSISLGVAKFLGLNIEDYESIKPTEKLSGEFINNISSSGFKILWNISDNQESRIPNWAKKEGGIRGIADWSNNSSVGKLLQRDYSEISSMEKGSIFNTDDRVLYHSLRLIQSLTNNPLNSRLAKKLGVDSITFINDENDSAFSVKTKNLNTIFVNLANLDSLANSAVDYDKFINAGVFEELIHHVALRVAPEGSDLYNKVINEVKEDVSGFKPAVEDIYKQMFSSDFTLLHEGVRMLIQEEFLGFITEETIKNNRKPYGYPLSLKQLFKDMWKYIADFFENNMNSKELANQIRDYINSDEFDNKFTTTQLNQTLGVSTEIETEEHKIIEELKKADQDKIVENVQDFSDAIKSRLSPILKNKNYERLKTILTSENGLNKWEALNTLLSDAAKSKTDFEDVEKNVNSLLRKARAIAVGIIQTDKIIDLIAEDVKQIISSKDNALDNILPLQYHLYALKDFKVYLEEARKTFRGSKETVSKINDALGKIELIEEDIIKNDQLGIIEGFKPYVTENIEHYLNYFRQEAERMRKLEANSKSKENKVAYKKQAEALEKHIKQWDLTQDKNIIEFLQGLRGDANLANTLLEAYSDSTDPVISSFTAWLKDQLHDVKIDVQRFEKEYEHELAPIYNKLGNRFNPEALGKLITNESERIDADNNSYKVVELLNEFSGTELFRGEQRSYQYIQQTFKNEERELLDLIKNRENVEENKKKLHEKRKESALWRRENMQQEFNSLFYEKYDLWEDPIGQQLKEDVEEIFTKINDLKSPFILNNQEIDEITEGLIEDLYKEYILLGNVNYLDGTPKEGIDLEKALKMQEIRALNRELYEYIDNDAQFEKAKLKHSEQILSTGIEEDSEEYKSQMKEWEDKNTRIAIKQDFYDYRESLFEELSILTENSPDFSKQIKEKYGDFESNWKIINGLEYGHRDEDNQVIGTEIQSTGAKRIKEAFENLETLQKILRRASGLTKEEFEEYQYLFANKDTLDREQLERFNKLNTKKKDKSASSKRISEIFKEIQELQSRIPTEYYISTFNNLSQKYGVSIDSKGFSNNTDILKSPEIIKLLKNDDFKEWFEINHIEVEVWDENLKQVVNEYKRLPHWNRIIPNDQNYIEIKPARKYSTRQVKPKYRTGYNPETGKVELKEWEHIDNKGNFLPKKGKFQSKEYEALKNAKDPQQKALFQLLKTHTKYHLKAQEDISNRNKLGLDIPRLRKSSTESNMKLLSKMLEKPSDIPSLIWNRIVSKWKSSTDYSQGEGNFQTVFADKYGNEHTSIPIKYTGKLDASDVSLDLFKAISKYSTSTKLNKKLVEISTVQQALQRILGKPDFNPLDLTKKIKGKDVSPKGKTNTRQFAIENIVRRVFQGEEKKMELGETLEKGSNIVKSLTVLKSIAFDIPASVANVLSAETQNFINSSNGYITASDLGKGHSLFATEYLPAFLKDYSENHIGAESLQSQIFDAFDFVQSETYESKIGEKISNSKIKDGLALNWLKNHRQWGETFVQTVNGLAYLNATKVEQTLPNGSKITISLQQAYELDVEGIIKLKNGIDEKWDLKGSAFKSLKRKIDYHNSRIHGNYAKGVDKPEANTYTLYSLWFMMKGFFISMALNRFAASKVVKTNKGFRFLPRYNQRAGAEIGYYLETLNFVAKEIEIKAVTGEFENLTESEKIAAIKSAKDVAMIALFYFTLRVIFGWDDDDEDKYKKLRENDYWTNQGLYQAARLLTETTTFINIKQYGGFIFDAPMVYKTLENLYNLIGHTLSGEEYKRDTGIYKKGESKAKANLYRAVGIEKVIKTTGDENQSVQDYMKLRAR